MHNALRRRALAPPSRESPTDPDCRGEEGAEGQSGQRVECAAGLDMARQSEAERGERGDLDGDRQARPIEPDPGDAGQLDIAKAHPLPLSEAAIGEAEDK